MGKPLSLNEIRSRCAEFVVQWRGVAGDERQEGQSFVRDLLSAFGITETRAALYERRANRSSTGRQGYIDALVPGLLIIELKSRGKSLGIAEQQALDYMNDLPDAEQPRFVLTSDFARFRLLDMHAPVGRDLVEFALEELPRHAESLAFLAGYQTRSFGSEQQETASIKAARIMADLFESLEGSGYNDHESTVFLVRTLFALYADDSGMWERDSFTDFVENRTSEDGSDLGAQLTLLFQVMNQPKRASTLDETLQRFPYVNGGVFEEPLSIPSFNRTMRRKLLEACAFNWSAISPAIFGSLFQAVKSAEARRELGEHYTTETNILKTLGPLFLDELRERFEHARHSVQKLKSLREHLGEIRYLDPACGSGNFIIVAYRELRALELDILVQLQELGDTSLVPKLQMYFERDDLAVRLEHMAGIEIEEWPARIAQTALRLVDHQANMSMQLALGRAPASLPLDSLSIIHVANALRVDWGEIVPPSSHTYVAGNPPFLGDNTRGADQNADLRFVWGKDTVLSRMDYVTGWHAKALELYDRTGYAGEWAFVTTSSITQGDQVPRLFGGIFDARWRIKFAHRSFAWSSEAPGAAAVHCVIVGFTRDTKVKARLFSYATVKSEPVEEPVETGINAYLLDAANVLIEKRSTVLSRVLNETLYGSKPTDGGNLIVEPEDYATVMADPIAARYVHRYIGAQELLHNEQRWCLWLDGMDPADVGRSRVLKARIEAVRDFRTASKAETTRDYPHHHLFRQLAKQDTEYVCIPIHVSETRRYYPVARLEADVIASNANFTIRDSDGFQFAAMSSSMFITWQKAIGGRLESRLRFASTLTWYTFPFPDVDADLRAKIIEAGVGVLTVRAVHPERSLADHYNPLAMDPALLRAHDALDRVVDKAFGATRALRSNEERQAILFERYQELTAASSSTTASSR